MLDGMDEHLASNRALWDEWADINARSEMYALEEFKRGGSRLRDYEIEEVGPVGDKTLLHLQCHFGIDSLSWARLGGLGEIVTALAQAGLRIEFLHEWPFVDWELPFLEKRGGRWWMPGELDGTMPLMYSLKATKPA
jgi:hypothetical protein